MPTDRSKASAGLAVVWMRNKYLEKAAPIVDMLGKIEALSGRMITIKDGAIIKSESTYRPELKAVREQCLEELRQLAQRFEPAEGNCTFPPCPDELANAYEMVRNGSQVQVTYPMRYCPPPIPGESDHAS